MALQSPGATGASSSVSRLLSSAKLTPTKSLFSSVDFLLGSSYSISKGIKRRNELSAFRGFTPLLKSSLRSPFSAKAAGEASPSSSSSDLKPEVIGLALCGSFVHPLLIRSRFWLLTSFCGCVAFVVRWRTWKI